MLLSELVYIFGPIFIALLVSAVTTGFYSFPTDIISAALGLFIVSFQSIPDSMTSQTVVGLIFPLLFINISITLFILLPYRAQREMLLSSKKRVNKPKIIVFYSVSTFLALLFLIINVKMLSVPTEMLQIIQKDDPGALQEILKFVVSFELWHFFVAGSSALMGTLIITLEMEKER